MTTSIKERPILFNGAMVSAILDGSKTQTRRILKLPPLQPWQSGSKGWNFIECDHFIEDCNNFTAGFSDGRGTIINIKCPYGKPAFNPFDLPADRLWVRETFCIESSKEVAYDSPHSDGRPIRHHDDEHWGPWWEQPHYRATEPTPELYIGTDEPGCRWRPLIFMPRWASRILLEVTAVRVERLQSISGPDCWAEGIAHAGWNPERYGSVIECYRDLWESIKGPGSWAANPWVWVVEFRRVQP
jgi:hypothetical protein